MNLSHKCEEFFGVYLLESSSPDAKYNGQVYIGFTVDPNRRIQQHNRGKQSGGARKTDSKGPWRMVMIVHGFPNNISALRFEWAWQQPKVSRRLKSIRGLDKKKAKESHFDHKFRILTEMLRIGPWNRLPLTIRWLSEHRFQDFPPLKIPPMHMMISFGRVKRHLPTPSRSPDVSYQIDSMDHICNVCEEKINAPQCMLRCLDTTQCTFRSHIICLATMFLRSSESDDSLIPIEGSCPQCDRTLLWGDLIRSMKGYPALVKVDEQQGSESDELISLSGEEDSL